MKSSQGFSIKSTLILFLLAVVHLQTIDAQANERNPGSPKANKKKWNSYIVKLADPDRPGLILNLGPYMDVLPPEYVKNNEIHHVQLKFRGGKDTVVKDSINIQYDTQGELLSFKQYYQGKYELGIARHYDAAGNIVKQDYYSRRPDYSFTSHFSKSKANGITYWHAYDSAYTEVFRKGMPIHKKLILPRPPKPDTNAHAVILDALIPSPFYLPFYNQFFVYDYDHQGRIIEKRVYELDKGMVYQLPKLSEHKMKAQHNKLRERILYEYDTDGNLVKETSAIGKPTETNYEYAHGNLIKRAQEDFVVTYEYNQNKITKASYVGRYGTGTVWYGVE